MAKKDREKDKAKTQEPMEECGQVSCEELEEPEDAVEQPVDEQPAPEEVCDIGAVVAELEKKRDEYLAMAQRCQADFENYRRRNEAAKTAAYQDGAADALTAMLPVADNFERAIAAAPQDEASKAMLDGITMVKKQFEASLSGRGVSEIPSAKGDTFDPTVHNAVMTAPLEEGCEAGTIAACLQKGYKLGERVIRYAMVSVYN